MTYIYTTQRKGKTVAGVVHASNPFKAVFLSRDEAFHRGADIKSILIAKI